MDYLVLGFLLLSIFGFGAIVGAVTILIKQSLIKAEFEKIHAKFDAVVDALKKVGVALEQ